MLRLSASAAACACRARWYVERWAWAGSAGVLTKMQQGPLRLLVHGRPLCPAPCPPQTLAAERSRRSSRLPHARSSSLPPAQPWSSQQDRRTAETAGARKPNINTTHLAARPTLKQKKHRPPTSFTGTPRLHTRESGTVAPAAAAPKPKKARRTNPWENPTKPKWPFNVNGKPSNATLIKFSHIRAPHPHPRMNLWGPDLSNEQLLRHSVWATQHCSWTGRQKLEKNKKCPKCQPS